MDFFRLAYPLEQLPFVIISLAAAFTLHEFAHAYFAYKFGDPTAKNQGRLTLSPLAHLDIFGTLLIIIAGFGWAKPVPVNRFFFKNPRLAGVVVSIAGPLSNLLLAFLGYAIWYGLVAAGMMNNIPINVADSLQQFFSIFIGLNTILFLFNLLPFPPLDGYRIIEDLVPNTLRAKMSQFEHYGAILFLVIVLTPLNRYVIQPYFAYGQNTIGSVFDLIFK
ncbi:site-2 protease family protein [Metabacillus sp. GX 13764]|uniref:site-2 protease family protein n=1 Tax=Metabacillus kandeliae TaxID=2900151 RepID=UPI001E4DA49F|nr:site-2 protease family protein [Metabacillus kandeliae]